jgi:hypothetical protein
MSSEPECYRKVRASNFVSGCTDGAGGDADRCVRLRSSAPEVFGPIAWSFLHTAAEHYAPATDSDRQQCRQFITSLPGVLPCRACSSHLTTYLEENAPAAEGACASTASLREFFVDLHNDVNQRNGNGVHYTPAQAKAEYGYAELCLPEPPGR